MKPAMTPQQAEFAGSSKSALQLYRELAVGEGSNWELLRYELILTTLCNIPGLLGFGLRSLVYPTLFAACGRRPAIGRDVVIRNAREIRIGQRMLLDDHCVLDVRGPGGGIEIGDYVSIGRFSSIIAKGGRVSLENGVNIGSYCRLATQSGITIGSSSLIAAYTYIGPGNHQQGEDGQPLIAQEMEDCGGVKIGSNAWIGTRATILDGVTIGDQAIVGAHSLVREDVPPNSIAVGVPAKVIKTVSGADGANSSQASTG